MQQNSVENAQGLNYYYYLLLLLLLQEVYEKAVHPLSVLPWWMTTERVGLAPAETVRMLRDTPLNTIKCTHSITSRCLKQPSIKGR